MEEYKTINGFPELYFIRQKLKKTDIKDVESYFKEKMTDFEIARYFLNGVKVGIAVGSRGIRNIDKITKLLASEVIRYGARPVIIPAMGSHGGANCKGQVEILNGYGITEEYIGVKIDSSMEVVDIGPAENGLHVYMDRAAFECDVIVAINRVKEHTDFYGETESGILKMLAVGLGNHIGASYVHSFSTKGLVGYIKPIAERMIACKPVIGIGIVEDGYGDIARIGFLSPDIIAGMRLTPESHGNAAGAGLLDLITRHFYDAIDFQTTFKNGMTSKCPERYKIPMYLEDDFTTVSAGFDFAKTTDYTSDKVLVIKNTGSLEYLFVSRPLLEEAMMINNIEVSPEKAVCLRFNKDNDYVSLFQ